MNLDNLEKGIFWIFFNRCNVNFFHSKILRYCYTFNLRVIFLLFSIFWHYNYDILSKLLNLVYLVHFLFILTFPAVNVLDCSSNEKSEETCVVKAN